MFEVEELCLDPFVEGFDVGLVVLLAGGDVAVGGAKQVAHDVAEAAVSFDLALGAGVLRAVVGLHDGALARVSAAAKVLEHGGGEDAGVAFGELVGEAQEGGAGFDVASGVLEADKLLVAGHLLHIVGNVVEVFGVDLELLEGLEAGLDLAHVALLLVLFLPPLCAAILAEDAGDGALAGGELAEVLEAAGAEAGGLVALAKDLAFLLGRSLVGAAVRGAGAIHEGAAGVVVLAPAVEPFANGLGLAAEGAGCGLDAVFGGVVDKFNADIVLQVLILGLGDP